MSDSVKKWHEMNEDGNTRRVYPGDAYITDTTGGTTTFIYESPDGGKTVTRRPFGGDIDNRETILEPKVLQLTEQEKKEAYKVLAYYEKNVILYAAKVLNEEGTLS